MAYTRVNWQDLPSTTTPINATNLNKMDSAIKEHDDKLLGNASMGNVVVESIRTKNMFDSKTLVQGDITGAYSTIRMSSRQALWLEAGTYTLSTNLPSAYNFTIQIQNVGVPPLSSYPSPYIYDSGWQSDGTTTKTFTLTTAGWFLLALRKSDNSTLSSTDISNIIASHYQLEKGITATTYSPYQELNSGGCKYFYNGYLTAVQTIGNTITDINNLTNKSITTYGKDLLVTVILPLRVSANGTGRIRVYIDNVEVNNRIITAANNEVHMYTGQAIITGISAGNHTITIKGQSDNSSYNLEVLQTRTLCMSVIEI